MSQSRNENPKQKLSDEEIEKLESNLSCPIMFHIFAEPVFLIPSGITVEKAAAVDMMDRNQGYPAQDMKIQQYFVNYGKKQEVEAYLTEHPEARERQYKYLEQKVEVAPAQQAAAPAVGAAVAAIPPPQEERQIEGVRNPSAAAALAGNVEQQRAAPVNLAGGAQAAVVDEKKEDNQYYLPVIVGIRTDAGGAQKRDVIKCQLAGGFNFKKADFMRLLANDPYGVLYNSSLGIDYRMLNTPQGKYQLWVSPDHSGLINKQILRGSDILICFAKNAHDIQITQQNMGMDFYLVSYHDNHPQFIPYSEDKLQDLFERSAAPIEKSSADARILGMELFEEIHKKMMLAPAPVANQESVMQKIWQVFSRK